MYRPALNVDKINVINTLHGAHVMMKCHLDAPQWRKLDAEPSRLPYMLENRLVLKFPNW